MQRDGVSCLIRSRSSRAALAKQFCRCCSSKIQRKPSHYEILCIDKEASLAEIKQAYIKLSKQYHPDKNVNDKSLHGVFLKVNEAYNVLADKEQRKEYDAQHGFCPIPPQRATAQNPFGVNTYSTYADSWYDEKYEEQLKKDNYSSNNRRDYQFSRSKYVSSKKPQNLKFFGYLIGYMIVGAGISFALVKYGHRKQRDYIDKLSEENNKLYENLIHQAEVNGPLRQLHLFREKIRQRQEADDDSTTSNS